MLHWLLAATCAGFLNFGSATPDYEITHGAFTNEFFVNSSTAPLCRLWGLTQDQCYRNDSGCRFVAEVEPGVFWFDVCKEIAPVGGCALEPEPDEILYVTWEAP